MDWRTKVLLDCPLLFCLRKPDYKGGLYGIHFGIETGDGWKDIIITLCNKIEVLIKELPQEQIDDGVACVQIKEKFGGLRFYMHGATEAMNNLIDQAELDSFKICESCGKPGEVRPGGWISTLCDSCHGKKSS